MTRTAGMFGMCLVPGMFRHAVIASVTSMNMMMRMIGMARIIGPMRLVHIQLLLPRDTL
jgi:hypothetical protein